MLELLRKLRAQLRRESIDADLDEEMRTHLEMKAAASGDDGAARRQFGNVTLLIEESRAVWSWTRLDDWLRDFRYAIRGMARRPGFSTTIVLTLALGIGASSALYSLIDAVLIRPLPYPSAERLVALYEAKASDPRSRTPVAPGRLADWQQMSSSFAALAGGYDDALTDTTAGSPERVSAAFVSPRFFDVLATAPILGRTFLPEEEHFGGPSSIVISEGFWRRRFASSPTVLGSRLILSDQSFTVVGVLPHQFQFPKPSTEIWLPKQANRDLLKIREARFYRVIAVLKPGKSLAQAQSEMASLQKRLGELYPRTDAGWTVAVEPLKDVLVGKVRGALWLLSGSVSLLLLIACANVACLLLARLNSRGVEIATRTSLGAGRAAIARQLLAEGMIYAAAGGLLGLAAVYAAIGSLRTQLVDIPRITELAVDGRIVLVAAGVSLLSSVLFSMAPMVASFRRDLSRLLIRGGRSIVGGGQRLPRVLVFAQFALATALLIGSSLFLRSLLRMESTPLGMRTQDVLALRVGASYNERPADVIQRHDRILRALTEVPGVASVAMSTGLPGVNSTWPREFAIEGEPSTDGELRFAAWRIVTAGYFDTVGIRLIAGQTCRMTSDNDRPFEVVVNQRFADRYFAGRDPLGHTIAQGPQGDVATRIVGVVADAREDGPGIEPQPLIYSCGYVRYWPDSEFLTRSANPAAIANAVRAAIRAVEPSRPVYSVRTLEDALNESLAPTRFRTLLVGLFSLLALALAAIGLYGVMAYMVSQRTREIGIRVALGARKSQVFGEVLRSGGLLAAGGAAVGVAIAAALSKVLGSLLFGVPALDGISYVAAVGVLLASALLACMIPSKRAASIDPVRALRER
jgi:predicted permease